MKQLLISILICIPIYGAAQGKQIFQLQRIYTPNYTETNNFLADSMWWSTQYSVHDIPEVVDEESFSRPTIYVKDTAAFLSKRIMHFPKDSLLATCFFNSWNVWLQPHDSISVFGEIHFLSSNPEGIRLKLELTATNLRTGYQSIYTGEREFVRKASIKEFFEQKRVQH